MDSLPERLDPRECEKLIHRAQQGDQQAKERLVEANLPMVWSLVKRFTGRGIEADDLYQVGSIGLLKAIADFDCERGLRFSTFAVPKIMGEMKMHIRDQGSLLRVSRSLKQRASAIIRRKDQLASEKGRAPTIRELAADLRCSREEIVSALDATAPVQSLDSGVVQQTERPCAYGTSDAAMDSVIVKQMMAGLTAEQRRILFLRCFVGWSQQETASALNISQPQVSRLERQIRCQLSAAKQ